MYRRILLTAPLVLAVPPAADPVEAGELRVVGPGAGTIAPVLRRIAGVPVRVMMGDAAMALSGGHAEVALLKLADLGRVHRAMGSRLLPVAPGPGVIVATRSALPRPVREAIGAAVVRAFA